MSRSLKTLVLMLMVALLPVRALAAVTTGFCAFAHHHGAAAPAEDSHENGSPAHDRGDTPCSSCIEHCSSAAFAPLEAPAALAEAPACEHSVLYQCSVAGFIPDPLDPPPLAA